MKFLRYLIFIPICLFVLGIIFLLFGFLLPWLITLSTFWLIVILLTFGGAIWMLFKLLSSILMSLITKISPSSQFAFWTVSIICVINGIWSIVYAWSMDINYSGKVIFGVIVFTILTIELTFALIAGAAASEE